MWIAKTSIKQPVLVTMMMLALVVFGLLAYQALPVDLLPDVSFPVVSVSVVLPGAGPAEMADQVAKPIEDAMGTLPGVRHITSRSNEGLATVVIEFGFNRQVDEAAQDVREKMAQIRPQLPQDIREPIVQKFDLSSSPIMSVAVASKDPSVPSDKLRQQLADEFVPRLQRVEGVAAADVTGGLQRQVQVNLDLAQLQARGITPQQVSQAIQGENVTVPLGKITQGGADVSLRAPGQFTSVEQIDDVNLATRSGIVHLHDIAEVKNGYADVTTLSRLNGEDTIRIDIRKQSGTNTVRVADDVKAELAKLFPDSGSLTYSVVRDDSIQVRNSVNDALLELLLGVVSAILVVLLFFRDARNTLVAVIGLPIILIATFAAMRMFDLTINMMTLLALTLCVGLVIDDAIVVRENIFRWMERGYDPKEASLKATSQVALSVLAMTLTIVAVFLPVAMVSGLVSGFFRPFGLTIAAAMVISLFEAFTLAPMLSAHFFKKKEPKAAAAHEAAAHANAAAAIHNAEAKEDTWAESGTMEEEAEVELGRMDRVYQRMLRWSLNHRLITLMLATVIIVASLVMARGLKFAFTPSIDSGQFSIGYRMPPGTSLAETDKVARTIETALLAQPEVDTVLTTIGTNGAPEQATLNVQLKHGIETAEFQDRLRPALVNVPNVSLSVQGLGPGGTDVSSRPIQIQLQSTGNLATVAATAEQVKVAIKDVPGAADIDSDYQPGRPELQIAVDRERAADQGVSTAAIGSTLRTLVNGQTVSKFREGGNDYDIVVRLRPEDRARVSDILTLAVPTTKGTQVPLNTVADIKSGSSPTRITRYDRLTQVSVGVNNVDRNLNDVVADIRAALVGVQLPPGVTINIGGTQTQQNEGFSTLGQAMLLSLVFIYMVLASQFGSFLQPLVIMLAIPLSFIGAFLGLRIMNMPLDILGMVGMILLIGLATKNSILLVDFTNRLRRLGMQANDALLLAAPARLRPILMTTLAIMLGSLPVAIGIGEGAEFRRPLAIVTIFGLLTSTLLTLFLVPVTYSLLDQGTRGGKRLLAARPFRRSPTPTPSPAVTSAGSAPGAD